MRAGGRGVDGRACGRAGVRAWLRASKEVRARLLRSRNCCLHGFMPCNADAALLSGVKAALLKAAVEEGHYRSEKEAHAPTLHSHFERERQSACVRACVRVCVCTDVIPVRVEQPRRASTGADEVQWHLSWLVPCRPPLTLTTPHSTPTFRIPHPHSAG